MSKNISRYYTSWDPDDRYLPIFRHCMHLNEDFALQFEDIMKAMPFAWKHTEDSQG